MKRYLSLLLVLVMALCCAAQAEEIPIEERLTLVRFYTQTEPITETFALIGEGNGSEPYNYYSSDISQPYDIRYAQVWNELTQQAPMIDIEGTISSLSCIAVESAMDANVLSGTMFLFNDEPIHAVDGLSVFVLLSAPLEEDVIPQASEDCDVLIWQPDGIRCNTAEGFELVNLCTNCGELSNDSIHTTAASKYCQEGHTLCMENTGHHCEFCGRDYPCAKSGSHVRCKKCGRPWCDRSVTNHIKAVCGHRDCEVYEAPNAHAKCAHCEGYLCDEKNHDHRAACGVHAMGADGEHGAAVCGVAGHLSCDGTNHAAAACRIAGHFACDGLNHTAVACVADGHTNCDGKDHSLLACGHHGCETIVIKVGEDEDTEVILPHEPADCAVEGHFKCDTKKNHVKLGCGHFACAEGDHTQLGCGHFACDGTNHAQLPCGHYECIGGDHAQLGCGHFVCDGANHAQLGCGHYECIGGDHAQLGCGHFVCDGANHAQLGCGHFVCDGTNHAQLPCGHLACSGGDHAQLGCGHFVCDGANHAQLPCGHLACSGGDHTQLSCGHFVCDGANHAQLPCGHFACAGGDHTQLGCGHFVCDGNDHSLCA